MADTYKVLSNHAEEVAGVMYAPGETLTLNKEQLNDVNIKDLIAIGTLMELKGGEKVNG